MKSNKIALLASGVGLGVYIPALIMKRDIEASNNSAEVYVIESLFTDNDQFNLELAKSKFQNNFRLAQAAYRFNSEKKRSYSPAKLIALFELWDCRGIDTFVLTTGFWLPVLEEYMKKNAKRAFNVFTFQIDSNGSPSWREMGLYSFINRRICLHDWHQSKINYSLRVSKENIIRFSERPHQVIIHGGGWGLGNFFDFSKKLSDEFHVNVCVQDMSLPRQLVNDTNISIIRQDLDWSPWGDEFKDNGFPPAIHFSSKGTEILSRDDYHAIYSLIQNCRAIISKPGGMTLVDSLSSSTPVIFIDGLKHEQDNMNLWIKLGIGMHFNDWQRSQFSAKVLHNMHERLNFIRSQVPFYEVANLLTT
jgi:hypothetical protein